MEFVVYTALLGLILVFLFNFLLGIIGHQGKGKIREAVISNTTHVANTIDYEIRRAHQIYDSTSQFDVASGQLSLDTRNSVPNGESSTYVDIYLNSENQVCIRRESDGVVCLTTDNVNVTQLQFKKITLSDSSESGIQTNLTVEYNTNDPDQKLPMNIQTFTRLRNE
ncbi:MAG: hypothetical protein R3346_01120 [Candidatus Spechtbacterales bacterium]|nr:hypothetical protein [Candidatus Spechtbacterales bacterium]